MMLLTLLGLGTWQIERLKWKQELLAKIENTDPKTFMPLEEIVSIDDIKFLKVKLRGTFHHDLSILLIPRTWNGMNGGHLYTPMTLSASGHTLLVNRGWIPKDQQHIIIQKPSGEIEILAYLQAPTLPGWLTPENVIDQKAWYYLDLEAIGDEIAKTEPEIGKNILPFYAIAFEGASLNAYPKSLDPILMLRNNHLGYALTWFSLAFVLIIMYIVYLRKQR